MVKRAVSVIFIVLLLVGFGVWELMSVNSFISSVSEQTSDIYTSFGQLSPESSLDPLIKPANALQKYWEKKENLLCMIHNHKDLSLVSNTLSRLCTSLSLGDYNETKQELQLLKIEVEKLPHIMTFSVQNVF